MEIFDNLEQHIQNPLVLQSILSLMERGTKVLTTNYDNLLEIFGQQQSKPMESLDLKDKTKVRAEGGSGMGEGSALRGAWPELPFSSALVTVRLTGDAFPVSGLCSPPALVFLAPSGRLPTCVGSLQAGAGVRGAGAGRARLPPVLVLQSAGAPALAHASGLCHMERFHLGLLPYCSSLSLLPS